MKVVRGANMQKEDQNQKIPEIIKECDITYMVLYRHFMMSGGVFTYGSAEIDNYYDTFKKADKAAKAIYKKLEGSPDLHVWIVRCIKTYCNGGIAIEKDMPKPVTIKNGERKS